MPTSNRTKEQLEKELLETQQKLYEIKAQLANFSEQGATTNYSKTQFDNTEKPLFLSALLEAIPNPIFYKDVEGIYQGCNHAFVEYTGLSKEQIIGKTVFDISTKKLAQEYKKADEELFNNPGIQRYKTKVRDSDNTFRDVVMTKATYVNETGDVAGLIGLIVDISELTDALEELKISQINFLNVVEGNPDAVIMVDEDHNIVFANRMTEEIFGKPRQDVIGTPFGLPLGDEKPTEVELVAADMKIKYGEMRVVPSQWHSKPASLVMLRDVTERILADKALQKSATMLKESQKIAKLGRWEFNQQTKELTWSESIYDIFGLSPKDFSPTYEKFLLLIHPDDRKYAENSFYNAVKNHTQHNFVHRIILPDESIRYVNEICQTEYNSKGEPIRSSGTLQDITDLKMAEIERDKLEEQLHQSQKLEAIGRLAGGVAHDFNNILTAIQGFGDLIADSLSENDPMQRDIQEILKAADSAAHLTKQLLAFSRKQIISPKVLDLNLVVSKSQRMLKRIIGEDVDLIFVSADDLWNVKFDPGQVEQILVNLVVNARDAMPDGGQLTIEMSNKTLDDSELTIQNDHSCNDFVLISISDTGIGMDPDIQKKMFDPFFTTKEQGKGTGLGLSTVYGILKQNNGFIKVLSNVGQGTTFEIYLPRIKDETKAEDEPVDASSIAGKETILLVEDQEIVRRLAERILISLGYTVISATDGETAMLTCKKHQKKIDLLLTDVVMPKMSGKELYNRMAQVCSNLKVLYMSGYTEDAIAQHGVLDSGTHFIQKPFRPQSLGRKIREVLDS